jgi:hypothetical protein
VNNKGAFAAGSTVSSAVANGAGAQSFAGDNTGSFTVTGAMDSSSVGGTGGGSITINGYQSVTVGADIKTWATVNAYGTGGGAVAIGTLANPIGGTISIAGGIKTSGITETPAGNITMYAAGPITIAGEIDQDRPNRTDGALSLNTSRDIKLGALDLSRTVSATLNCGVSCLVTGVVASFSTAYTGGGGVPLDPYVATQTQLRAPAGKKVMYHPEVSGNAYLNGGSYRVADLNGNAGLGGMLTPYQARGTVVLFK